MPAVSNREASWAKPVRAAAETPIAKVLVVDDKREIADNTADILHDAGFLCDIADDLRQALAAVRVDGEISMVVIDTNMPGLNNAETIRALLECRPGGGELAVIIVTSCENINMTVESLRLGATDFLIKPVVPDHLACAMTRAVARMSLKTKVAA